MTDRQGEIDQWVSVTFGVDPRGYPAQVEVIAVSAGGAAIIGVETAMSELKELVRLGRELVTGVEDLIGYMTAHNDGCWSSIAAAIVSGLAVVPPIAAAIIAIPADATPAVPAAVTAQAIAITVAVLAAMQFVTAAGAVIECKQTNLENARKEKRAKDEVDALQKQVKEMQEKLDRISRTIDRAKAVGHKRRAA